MYCGDPELRWCDLQQLCVVQAASSFAVGLHVFGAYDRLTGALLSPNRAMGSCLSSKTLQSLHLKTQASKAQNPQPPKNLNLMNAQRP